jgi:hypothetical protein
MRAGNSCDWLVDNKRGDFRQADRNMAVPRLRRQKLLSGFENRRRGSREAAIEIAAQRGGAVSGA